MEYETPYKMIRTTNVKKGRVDLTEAKCVDEATFIKWNRRLTPEYRDIVLTREAPLGDVGLIRTDEKVFLGQRTMLFRANPDLLDQHFLYYTLLGPTAQAQIRTFGSGSTVEHVRVPDAEKITIPYPDLATQRKIAAILTAYDDLIEVNKRRIALLEKMAEELYREWFVRLRFPGYQDTRFVKGVPEGWEILKFSDICNFIKGKTPSHLVGNPLEDYLPYVNAAYLRGQEREFAKRERNSVTCDHGDVLMLMDGSNSGLVFRAQAGIVASTFARIELDLKYRHFIFEYLKATQESIISNNTGSAVPHANKEFINRLIIFAPKDDQLLNSFNENYQSLHDQCANLYAQNENLTKTRDLLLPRLISGKLSVEDLDIQFPPSMQETTAGQESRPEVRHA